MVIQILHNNNQLSTNNNQVDTISTLSMPQSRTDLDSYADTCVVGCNSLITHYHETNVQPICVIVVGYDPSLPSVRNINVVNAAIAYDCPHTGEVIIFKINQAIRVNTVSNN